jgi:hypothetical protein
MVNGWISVNGSQTIAGDNRVYKTTGNVLNQPARPTLHITTTWYFSAGDYFEVNLMHDLAVSRNVEASSASGICYASEAWITRLG